MCICTTSGAGAGCRTLTTHTTPPTTPCPDRTQTSPARRTPPTTTCPASPSPAHTTATTTGDGTNIFLFMPNIFHFVRNYFPLNYSWLYYGTLNHWRPRSWFSFFDVPLQTGLQRDLLLIKQIISCSTSKGNFRNSAPRHLREMFHCKTSK